MQICIQASLKKVTEPELLLILSEAKDLLFVGRASRSPKDVVRGRTTYEEMLHFVPHDKAVT
jgi:hypothetical protein